MEKGYKENESIEYLKESIKGIHFCDQCSNRAKMKDLLKKYIKS